MSKVCLYSQKCHPRESGDPEIRHGFPFSREWQWVSRRMNYQMIRFALHVIRCTLYTICHGRQ